MVKVNEIRSPMVAAVGLQSFMEHSVWGTGCRLPPARVLFGAAQLNHLDNQGGKANNHTKEQAQLCERHVFLL